MYLPPAALDERVCWQGVDHTRATAKLQIGLTTVEVTITVAAAGALTELVLTRWGYPGGTSVAEHSFGARFTDEVTFGGLTLPRKVTAAWLYGTPRWPEGVFIRYSIDEASYSPDA
ncbi:MAG: hypothetical protein K0S98_1499 [Propionibacteriaceae bacterium]|nr:hypothetical protein [Propionibacteriaceae bacterium]